MIIMIAIEAVDEDDEDGEGGGGREREDEGEEGGGGEGLVHKLPMLKLKCILLNNTWDSFAIARRKPHRLRQNMKKMRESEKKIKSKLNFFKLHEAR